MERMWTIGALLWLCCGASCGGREAAHTPVPPPADDAGRAAVSGGMAPTPRDAAAADAGESNGCEYAVQPPAGRLLGIDLLDVNASESFDDNLARSERLHVRFLTLHLPWSALEITPGDAERSGTLVDPGSALQLLGSLGQSRHLGLSLTLRPIDATGKTVPPDLANKRFDDPVLIARFEKLLDFVLARVPASALVSLMIGNEVDGYDARGETDFWIGYAHFLAALRQHVHAAYPGLQLGFTATFAGLTDPTRKTRDGWPAQEVLQTFAQQVDVVGVTYYPLNDDFSHREPGAAGSDLMKLTAAVPQERPIYIQEAGYASSAQTGSSEAQQERFFCELFHAWDAHATRIPRLALLRLNDVTPKKAQELAGPYATSAPAFVEYLRTLGLRSAAGSDKPSFSMVASEAARRGL